MMNFPLGGTMRFTPDEGVEVALKPAAISKADAREIGLTFCEASDDEREALLAALGPTMLKRSLLVFANTAARVGEPGAATFARDLRERIVTTRGRRNEGVA
ncbi:hypothetical protein [Nocardioides antri]|uniref:Uncharacterized protein n=1 Tax=Nocardioides antri TaxID=2607659 RepID=A0A5B1LRG3_9ACTN|nr:hypothetical protein [Nocardioides antri]KAA1423193.1 hypothetical protein F0U47_20160 [Nocardioides antri]